MRRTGWLKRTQKGRKASKERERNSEEIVIGKTQNHVEEDGGGGLESEKEEKACEVSEWMSVEQVRWAFVWYREAYSSTELFQARSSCYLAFLCLSLSWLRFQHYMYYSVISYNIYSINLNNYRQKKKNLNNYMMYKLYHVFFGKKKTDYNILTSLAVFITNKNLERGGKFLICLDSNKH